VRGLVGGEGGATSAIALITRRSWLQKVACGFSAVGLVLGVLALLHV